MIIGVGVGPTFSGKGVSRVKSIINGASEVYVRDEESKSLLVREGVEENKITISCDIVINLNSTQIPSWAKSKAIEILSKFSHKKRLLGLHLPSLKGGRQLNSHFPFYSRSISSKLIKIVELLGLELNHREDIVPVWINTGWNKKFDHDLRKICAIHLPNAQFPPYHNHWTTAALIGELDAVITTMLHVGITAWALDVPCCAYASHGKTHRFYRQIGRENFVCNDKNDIKIIKNWVNLFVEDYKSFCKENSDARINLKKRAQDNMQIITQWLKRNID